MDTYHDSYVDVSRGGQEHENGYGYGGRPRAQYGGVGGNMNGPSGTPTPSNTISAGASSITVGASEQGSGPSATPPAVTVLPTPRRMSSSSTRPGGDAKDDVPIGFDEGILRGLCDMDCALPLLADRIKQSVQSCKQISQFFRDRAVIEERYGRTMSEMARNANDLYTRSDGKAGSFVTAFQANLRVQEQLATNRMRFSQRLQEMSDELNGLAREGEKQRKIHKENGMRYQGILQESEGVMDKAKSRFDSTAEELERILVAKEGENYRDANLRTDALPNNKRGLGKALNKGLFKGKNPAQMQKHEDDVRQRMAAASESFRKAVLDSQTVRQEYFNFQLPKIVRLLKDCADELDMGMQYHLTRYAFMYESTVVGEGTTLCQTTSEDGPGLKTIFENIDNRMDFKAYMQNYAVARNVPKGPRREGLYDDGYAPPVPPHVLNQPPPALQNPPPRQDSTVLPPPPAAAPNGNGNGNGNNNNNIGNTPSPAPPPTDLYAASAVPSATGATFGVELGDQLARDATEVPKVVLKCAEAIEAYGIESMGIYRLSGTTSKVQALKGALDKDVDGTNVMDEQWSSDINVVSSALKLWFRELPEPLLTYGLYHGFVEAARYENDRLRHIRLHEQVNELPDPNYATLKYFMGHLDRIRRKEGVNQMSASNLSIVFGPTLLGAPPEEGGLNLEHMNYQCKAVETILEKYQEIFVEEDDGGDTATPAA